MTLYMTSKKKVIYLLFVYSVRDVFFLQRKRENKNKDGDGQQSEIIRRELMTTNKLGYILYIIPKEKNQINRLHEINE